MDYLTIKALHLIGMVAWFAGLFYIPRLYIYDVEAEERPEVERQVLQPQLRLMARRLWYGITWPAMIFTLGFGLWLFALYGAKALPWVHLKLTLIALLVVYHLVTGRIRKGLVAGTNRWTSTQLRLWNEVATVHLIITVLVASTKSVSPMLFVWVAGVIGALTAGVMLYKRVRLGAKAKAATSAIEVSAAKR